MNNICTKVQEAISWGDKLPDEQQHHVLSCPSCNQAAVEFAKLDAAMRDRLEVRIPNDFADRVMGRIASGSKMDRLSGWLAMLLELRPVQYGLVSVGVLITFGNLIRFVFAVILPVSV